MIPVGDSEPDNVEKLIQKAKDEARIETKWSGKVDDEEIDPYEIAESKSEKEDFSSAAGNRAFLFH